MRSAHQIRRKDEFSTSKSEKRGEERRIPFEDDVISAVAAHAGRLPSGDLLGGLGTAYLHLLALDEYPSSSSSRGEVVVHVHVDVTALLLLLTSHIHIVGTRYIHGETQT